VVPWRGGQFAGRQKQIFRIGQAAVVEIYREKQGQREDGGELEPFGKVGGPER